MDDRSNRNHDYRDFFNRKNDDSHREAESMEKDEKQDGTYYYSYGPFKSSAFEDNQKTERFPVERKNDSLVEVTEYPASSVYSSDSDRSSTNKQKRRLSPVLSMFALFMAGAIVMAGLMFSADYFNWFTGHAAPLANGSSTISTGTTMASDSSFQNTNLSIVRPNTIADIVEAASPSVVKIETYGTVNNRRPSLFDDDFFRYFFGDGYNQPQTGEKRQLGAGSGFIFDQDGYILTNEHVINGADEIYVTVLGYKDRFKAELLGSDFDLDLAVLKIEGKEPFPVLPMGNSSEMRVGDWVTAIGNPLGFDHTVSVGVLSANEREIQIPDQQERRIRQYQHLLQTDAAINQGNSGGPLLNLKGEVIGINTAVSAQAQGIGFAIPTSTVMQVLDHLKSNKPIPKPFIGIGLTDINENWLDELGLDSTEGTIITQVYADSSASRAGLRPYDVIVEIDGEKVLNAEDFVSKVQEMEIGQKITLTVIRDGQKFETAVIVGDRNK